MAVSIQKHKIRTNLSAVEVSKKLAELYDVETEANEPFRIYIPYEGYFFTIDGSCRTDSTSTIVDLDLSLPFSTFYPVIPMILMTLFFFALSFYLWQFTNRMAGASVIVSMLWVSGIGYMLSGFFEAKVEVRQQLAMDFEGDLIGSKKQKEVVLKKSSLEQNELP